MNEWTANLVNNITLRKLMNIQIEEVDKICNYTKYTIARPSIRKLLLTAS